MEPTPRAAQRARVSAHGSGEQERERSAIWLPGPRVLLFWDRLPPATMGTLGRAQLLAAGEISMRNMINKKWARFFISGWREMLAESGRVRLPPSKQLGFVCFEIGHPTSKGSGGHVSARTGGAGHAGGSVFTGPAGFRIPRCPREKLSTCESCSFPHCLLLKKKHTPKNKKAPPHTNHTGVWAPSGGTGTCGED